MAPEGLISVQVLASPAPREVLEVQLALIPGSTVADALAASGLHSRCPDLFLQDLSLGIWGRPCGPEQALREGDRVELCRALTVDPKVARRERFTRQGARRAGLFGTRRPGAKAGY